MSAVAKFEGMAGKGASLINFSSPFADCSASPCSFYKFPTEQMEAIRAHGSIPFFSWASQSTPSSLDEPDFQLSDVIAGHLRRLHPRIRRSGQRLGPPLLPPLQLGDERQLVPLGGGRQRQPARRIRRRLAPRARHLHRGRRHQRDLGLVPQRRPRPQACSDLAPLYPGDEYVDWTGLDGYNWGTNPARPDRWRSFDDLFRSTYDQITETIAPSKPLIDQRGRLDRVRRLEGGLDRRRARIGPHRVPAASRPALVRQVRRRDGLADRELQQRHQRLRGRDPEPGLPCKQLRLDRLGARSNRLAEPIDEGAERSP